MGSQQQFCLRWNNHQMNLLNVFDNLLQNESFVDVTLACDGLSLKAHKVVLSACSPYFQKLLLENPCPHPIVILKDVNYADLKALVDYMYKGEVNVLQDQLAELLKTAELLKIRGLSQVSPMSYTLDANVNQKQNSGTNKEIGTESVQLCATVTPVTPVNASTTSPSSPPSKRKRVRQQQKLGSVSETEENVLEMNGPPEVIESRVDVPRNARNANETPRQSRCNVNNGVRVPKDEDSDDGSDPGIPEQNVHEGFGQENDDILNPPSLDPPTLLGMTTDYSPSHQYNSSLQTGLSSDLSDATLEDGNKNNMSRHEEYNELATISTAITATQSLNANTMATTPEHCDPERKTGGHVNLGPQWTTNDMGHTLESIRNGRVTLTKASAMYSIPSSTTLWQRVKREGNDANKRDFTIASNWTEEDLHQALEAIRTGRLSITKAAVTFGIPNTTLWQRSRRDGIDTSRMSGSAHQSNYTEANLSQALDAIGTGRMSVNKASSTFGIPSSTLWSRAKRYGIETGRKRLWDQDRDEIMWQALQAVKAGAISMTQASIKFNVPYTTLWNHFKKWEMSTGQSLSGQSVPVSSASSTSSMSLNMSLPPPPNPLTAPPHHHLLPSNNTPMGIGQHGGIPMLSQHHSVPHSHQHPHPHPIENIIPDNANNNSMNS